MNHAEQKQKKRFVLTMRNEKGQVGIFVALIFQVIFVFFAMLVNVGLVVHHKINLQQSTDLAAYYGAMKQAEIMNVMAHVNFQIRQAWKLMSWRYRVLGTFGLEHNGRPPPGFAPVRVEFPVTWSLPDYKPRYNPLSRNTACNVAGNANGLTITDIPFMCLGHNGFGDWISSPNDRETYCKIECNGISEMKAFSITAIPGVGTGSIYGNAMGASVNAAIGRANAILEKTCNTLGPITTQMLALYYGNYIKDTQNRRNFIYMMTKNLGLPESQMLDIEGNSILKGVKNTLKNNLTEANLTSMPDSSIVAFNGAKSFGGGQSFAESMMREINFQRLMFFMMDCAYTSGSNVELKSIYQGATGNLDARILNQLNTIMDPASVSAIENLFNQNSEKSNILGYEKNPWIQVYYGVKATAEPKIPFLPLAKIKLNAVSFAKPFGGTIGPWYFKTWDSGTDDNKGRADWENRTDMNLPKRNLAGLTTTPTLKDAREFLFNYSTHVGDTFSNNAPNKDPGNKGGLANTDVVAFYHLLLSNKYGHNNGSPSSSGKTREIKEYAYEKPQRWPKYADWYHLASDVVDDTYDPLAVDRQDGPNAAKNTYMRDIEISVVSPNQFDTTYYSIDPDYFTNYANKLQGAVIQKIVTATGTSPAPLLPLDFGHRRVQVDGIPPKFNVRNQMQVTHDMFKMAANEIASINGSAGEPVRFALDVLATRQSSLLTGWTFLNLSTTGYSTFPSADATGGKYTMLFGTCDNNPVLNPWTNDYKAPYELDGTLPPAPGNCVTGGRTGYSVKLISSELLRSGKVFDNLGGPGTTGQIKNPVPEDFLMFPN